MLLHPMPSISYRCPSCAAAPLLETTGFNMPGLFVFGDCRCPSCGKRLWVHLPVGFAVYNPTAIEPDTGTVYASRPNEWFAQVAASGWRSRSDAPVAVRFVEHRPVKRPLIVNCLDNIYGHCLMKLYTVPRQIAENADRDVIVIVQKANAWMVPDGTAETWIVDLPLRQIHVFHADLHRSFANRLSQWDEVAITGGVVGEDVDITQFTRTAPFDYGIEAALAKPCVTFTWREDRCWIYRDRPLPPDRAAQQQAVAMSALAETLRQRIAEIDIAVVGFGRTGTFPDWVKDWRVPHGGAPDELQWVRRYAESHVVFGPHGSGMLLPAAHAASSVEMIPLTKHGNVADAYSFLERKSGIAAVKHHRFLPMSATLSEIATILLQLIKDARTHAYWVQLGAAPNQDAKYRFHLRYGRILAYEPPMIVTDPINL